jgi:peptide chain release factor 2
MIDLVAMVVVVVIAILAAHVDQASSLLAGRNTHHHHHRRRCHHDSAAFSWEQQSQKILTTASSSSSSVQSKRQDKLRLHGVSSSSKEGSQLTDLTSLRKLLSQATSLHDKNLDSTLPYTQITSRLHDLEIESSDPTFWDASNSVRNEAVTKEIARYSRLKEEMELWDRLRNDATDALDLLEELYKDEKNDDDEEMIALTQHECQSSAQQLLQLSQKYELSTLLSGPYDNSPCRLLLTAGAGGTEACDWVSMLYRMYSRHASYMDYTVRVVDESDGDVVGYKSIELFIDGPLAYGWFKGEKGAHRLVRLSPFNANNKRQTTFAGVDVIPVLEEEEIKMVDIPDKELEITTMRSGGKGGQNVNKVETGVRIKHIPSGLSVKCTEERSQLMNKQIALNRLKAQLLAIAQEQRLQDINAIRGDIVEASWGAQIRNYVMQPYKMVKDGRSEWETSDVDGVLDGGAALEEFVGAYLRWMRAKEEKEREEMEL